MQPLQIHRFVAAPWKYLVHGPTVFPNYFWCEMQHSVWYSNVFAFTQQLTKHFPPGGNLAGGRGNLLMNISLVT